MRRPRLAVSAFLLVPALLGIAPADQPTRPRASWEERDAEVLAFSPVGRTLVMAGREGARLRDADTGQVRAVLTTRPHQVHAPVFSPDGRLLFAKVRSAPFAPVPVFDLKVWDVATGESRATFPYISEHINASTGHFTLSPDGGMLAFLDNSERMPMQVSRSKMVLDGRHEIETAYNANPGLPRVKLWNVPRWEESAVLDGGSHMVFSPDGTTLVTGSRDWRVPVAKVWDTATGELRAELVGEAQWVKPMAFSPDGKFLAIGSGDQALWEPASGKNWKVPVKLLGIQSPVFSPDGALLFPNGLPRGYPAYNMNQEFPCYDVSTLPPRRLGLGAEQLVVQPLTYNEARLLISPASMRYASFGDADEDGRRTVVLRDLPALKELGRFAVTGLIIAELSPDGRWLVIWRGRNEPSPDKPGVRYRRQLLLLDPQTGRVIITIPTPDEMWGDPKWQFSPDGKTLAVSYTEGTGSDPDISERPRTVDLWDVPPR